MWRAWPLLISTNVYRESVRATRASPECEKLVKIAVIVLKGSDKYILY